MTISPCICQLGLCTNMDQFQIWDRVWWPFCQVDSSSVKSMVRRKIWTGFGDCGRGHQPCQPCFAHFWRPVCLPWPGLCTKEISNTYMYFRKSGLLCSGLDSLKPAPNSYERWHQRRLVHSIYGADQQIWVNYNLLTTLVRILPTADTNSFLYFPPPPFPQPCVPFCTLAPVVGFPYKLWHV